MALAPNCSEQENPVILLAVWVVFSAFSNTEHLHASQLQRRENLAATSS